MAMNFRVGSGYWLRLPIFGWYTSKGWCVEGNGVCPDVPVEISPEARAAGEDNQLFKAVEIARFL
jgi:C-terminal processing protease CtpA/Prc